MSSATLAIVDDDKPFAEYLQTRRQTAEYLQVSYKTLLNKMKECGISESPTA